MISVRTPLSARVPEVNPPTIQGSELAAALAHSYLQAGCNQTKTQMSQEEVKLEESLTGQRPQLAVACLHLH